MNLLLLAPPSNPIAFLGHFNDIASHGAVLTSHRAVLAFCQCAEVTERIRGVPKIVIHDVGKEFRHF
jgi:hypothetical protein